MNIIQSTSFRYRILPWTPPVLIPKSPYRLTWGLDVGQATGLFIFQLHPFWRVPESSAERTPRPASAVPDCRTARVLGWVYLLILPSSWHHHPHPTQPRPRKAGSPRAWEGPGPLERGAPPKDNIGLFGICYLPPELPEAPSDMGIIPTTMKQHP